MAGVATSLSIQDRMSKELNKIARASANLNKMLETTDRLSDSVDAGSGFSRVAAKANTAATAVDGVNKKQQQTKQGANQIANAWDRVNGMIKGAVAAFGVKQIIGLADEMTQTTARLNLMNDGLQTTKDLQQKIFASANRSRASYQDTAKAVAKLGMNAGHAFLNNDEMIAFSEQINKQFVVNGVSANEASNAMLQLTQAMGSGVLRGDELNSIMENAPSIGRAIEQYMGAADGSIREMAADGLVTAEIVKNAMLSAAAETNAKFAEMPMTFGQLVTIISNVLLQAFQPIINSIGKGAQWIYDNWSMIAPVFYGVAAAVGAYVIASQASALWTSVNTAGTIAYNVALMAKSIAMGIVALATGNATLMQQALNTAMLASPIGWLMLGIGILIAVIYKWIQSVGGIQIAWEIAKNVILTGWDSIKTGFMTGIYFVINMWNKLQLALMTAGVNIANFMGDMKVNVLMILQNMVNGAIDIINSFIGVLNKIPGVNIDLIGQMTFGTTAQLENEAAKQARNQGLDVYRSQIEKQIAERDASLNLMKENAREQAAAREAEISKMKAAKAQEQTDATGELGGNAIDPYSGGIGNIDKVGEVGKIKEDVNIAEEDLKFLRDIAEMRYIQNFVTLTPTVAVDAKISESVDLDEVVNRIERKLEDEFIMTAEGVYN